VDLDRRRSTLAQACRVLAQQGLVQGHLGHLSARVDEDSMLIRCRPPDERGVLHTRPADIRLIGLDGEPREDPEGRTPPNELPLHAEVYRHRADIQAVVHAHPWATLICGVAEVPIRPRFGAFDIVAAKLALGEIPVYPSSRLVDDQAAAREIVATMGDHDVCILRGHGVVVGAGEVELAVLRTLQLDLTARATIELSRLGAGDKVIPRQEVEALPDLGADFEAVSWRCLSAEA
jgi:ribulose-5-phosphate 4-epimerase/fuculose-1-phosphate aldolase